MQSKSAFHALAQLHDAGVIQNDINLANIVWDDFNKRAFVIDLALSIFRDDRRIANGKKSELWRSVSLRER